MIIRVQSEYGTKRFQISETDRLSNLFELTAKAFNLDPNASWELSRSRKLEDAFKRSTRAMVKSTKLKEGDMVYVVKSEATGAKPGDSGSKHIEPTVINVKEDYVDKIIEAMDGRIKRDKGPMCHHPDSGVCIHCVPLEPSDLDYLSLCDPPVKFMSFHAYLRKLRGGHSKGKFVTLENVRCSLRGGCTSHPPWPEGICTQCQPKPVTLEVQPYRHVDYVQFENGEVMEGFLEYWRATAKQRIGILLGDYAPFDTTGSPPLAIKAVVAAIYEPPQEATSRSVRFTCPLDQLLPESVKEAAVALNLRPVGWIFTDLTASGTIGTVQHYRGDMDTFFMSAEECLTAAHLQNLHPNPSRYSPDGHFGSKFVTVVVTGGADKQIHFEAYQVSNVAMSLESAGILVPTFDAPELGYIRESTKDQFVPDVFYSSIDKYGNKVTKIGRPLPIEYLLVDLPAAFPLEQTFTFAEQGIYQIPKHFMFPIENREDVGHKQNIEAFARHFAAYGREKLYACLSNFHVLAWLSGQVDSLPLDKRSFNSLLETLKTRGSVSEWAKNCPSWNSLELILQTLESGSGMPGGSTSVATATTSFYGQSGSSNSSKNELSETDNFWACQHCTLYNSLDRTECEMCGLPRRI
ncbi:unnamed protein product [Hymenolepis diminuta]|uniref:Nuclear protein localization protein 4 n=1 Tax=Hymenolepis diminuta TaxID=6216 RepID=A0A0R3SH60_HYMDI|nr:unnamed protein product [Hymenolepis diminuta]